MAKKLDYQEKSNFLYEKKEKFLLQKKKIEDEINQVNVKIRELEKAQTFKDLDKSVVVLKKTGLKIADVIKAINSGDFSVLQEKLSSVENFTNVGLEMLEN